jgi:hypothetical protein
LFGSKIQENGIDLQLKILNEEEKKKSCLGTEAKSNDLILILAGNKNPL